MADQQQSDAHKIDATGWWVLFATISASSMAFIAGSALNVALPAIQREFNASGGDLLWIINSYALFLAALLLLGGSLGDHYGRKRIYMIGIVIFTLASVVSGLAPNSDFLIFFRAVQGIGGAMMVPGSLAIVSAYFDDQTRGKAIGYWSSVITLTSIAGPVLGGIFADNGLWRGIFFINIPLAIAALYALWTRVPESYDEGATPHFDYIGAILVALGMAGITYGSIGIGEIGLDGLQRPDLLVSLVGGVILLIAFVIWEGRTREPMMPLRLFESSTFLGSNLLTLFLYGTLGGLLYFFPLNLIQIQGYSETFAGLALVPWSIFMVILSPFMGTVVDRIGAKIPLIVGPALVGFGFIAITIPSVTEGASEFWWTFFPATMLFGLGFGILVAPLTTAVMGSVPQQSAGIASGVNNAMSRASQVLALSILGGIGLVIFTSNLTPAVEALDISQEAQVQIINASSDLGGIQLPDTLSEDEMATVQAIIKEEFVAMFRMIMWVCAGLSFISALLAGVFIEDKIAPEQDED